jgi:hypothetical protein
MKKTTLLIIGAIAFVLSTQAAPITIYSDDFESQAVTTPPAAPLDGFGNTIGAPWTGNSSSQTWGVENVAQGEGSTHAAVLSWAITDTTSWGTGYSSSMATVGPIGTDNALSDITFSIDVASPAGNATTTLWFTQNLNGITGYSQIWAAYYNQAVPTDGSWTTITFTLADMTVQYPGNATSDFNPNYNWDIHPDGGGNYAIGTDTIYFDNFLVTANNPVPEPGTIALLTLGGLAALVGIRRRA